jgi:hypothetical protein
MSFPMKLVIGCQTKPVIAAGIIAAALDAGALLCVYTGDAIYGAAPLERANLSLT